MSGMRSQTVYCSFCGRTQHEVRVLVSKDDGSAAICDECVQDVLKEMGPTMHRLLDLEDEVRRLGT